MTVTLTETVNTHLMDRIVSYKESAITTSQQERFGIEINVVMILLYLHFCKISPNLVITVSVNSL